MVDNILTDGIHMRGKKYIAVYKGEEVGGGYTYRQAEIAFQKAHGTYVDGRKKRGKSKNKAQESVNSSTCSFAENTKFCIDERFDFLYKAVQMAAIGTQPSVVICGSGGLGKTFTVRKALEDLDLVDLSMFDTDCLTDDDRGSGFVFVKGYSTPKALYRSLYDNNGATIVYDDCDSVLKDANALNILKAALDSYDTRLVSWGSEGKSDDSLPKKFEFTGQIIFITNMDMQKIDQAVRSRSMMVDVSMTIEETIERMSTIVKSASFLPDYAMDAKMEVLEFLDSVKYQAVSLSLRTLITTCKIRHELGDDWRRMAEYVVCNG